MTALSLSSGSCKRRPALPQESQAVVTLAWPQQANALFADLSLSLWQGPAQQLAEALTVSKADSSSGAEQLSVEKFC